MCVCVWVCVCVCVCVHVCVCEREREREREKERVRKKHKDSEIVNGRERDDLSLGLLTSLDPIPDIQDSQGPQLSNLRWNDRQLVTASIQLRQARILKGLRRQSRERLLRDVKRPTRPAIRRCNETRNVGSTGGSASETENKQTITTIMATTMRRRQQEGHKHVYIQIFCLQQ